MKPFIFFFFFFSFLCFINANLVLQFSFPTKFEFFILMFCCFFIFNRAEKYEISIMFVFLFFLSVLIKLYYIHMRDGSNKKAKIITLFHPVLHLFTIKLNYKKLYMFVLVIWLQMQLNLRT